ncbi:uncharacterized protein BDFB_000924, partial [Asbolus verrucosus]
MAKAIKGSFNMYIRKFHPQYRVARFMCSYPKGTSWCGYQAEPHSSVSDLTVKHPQLMGTDFLFNNLKSATNARSVLDMVAAHNSIMNNKHIMQALRSLFSLQKQGNSDLSTQEILGHKDFHKLCRQLRNHSASIELNDTIEALKVVSYVGVPSDTTIVQVLLQLIRHNINLLNLQQIIFLDFLLSQFKSSPLVDALKIALPIVFEIHLSTKMEYDNISHLADYLFFASRNRMNEGSVEKIVNALMTYSEYDAKIAKSVIWSICDMENNNLFRPLIKRAIDSLMVHLDELDFNCMETTLSKLIARYSRKSSYFYDETFYDSCADYVIDKDLGYKHSIYVLRKFSRVNHSNNFLLDYMSKKIHENSELIVKGDPVDVYSIVVATSLTDYRPVHWDHLKELIAKTENMAHINKKEIIWIKFASALCLLDIYKLDILTKCLNENFLQNLFRKRFMSDFENYSTIWQCIKFFKPELDGLLTPKLSPEILIKTFRQPMDFPLEASLHKVLGGEKYVKTNIYSKLGHQIDHAVVFRKGGYPVAMNYSEDIEFIEDIEVQPDNQLLVILVLRHFNYTLNSRKLRCSTLLSMKVLESKGISVVPVCLEVWENLPDFEKIPYLMQAIKERTDNDLRVSKSVI